MNRTIPYALLLGIFFSFCANAQNWYQVDSTTPYENPEDSVWRKGPVLISSYKSNPFNNKFSAIERYDSTNNRAAYFSLNEPDDWSNADVDSTRVGLALSNSENHTTLVASNFANFYDSVNNTDVHNSTSEFNFVRGMTDSLGFRDGGRLAKSAVLKLSSTFAHNNRAYSNEEFDILNLRFFTDSKTENLASIDHFYGIRLENFRGVNANMIQEGWGVYIQPEMLKNYFAGKLGLGTTSVSHKLTVHAEADPVKLEGIQKAADLDFLTLNADGVLHKKSIQAINENFLTVSSDIELSNAYFLFIHTGGDAVYTLPSPASRVGLTWKIVNVGSGMITFSEPYFEGNESRTTLLNKAGRYSLELFSDGTRYIALK